MDHEVLVAIDQSWFGSVLKEEIAKNPAITVGDVMPRLGSAGAGLTHVRTFEFLLPDAFTYGVYCRGDEDSKEVLTTAAAIGKLGRKLFA